MDRCGHGLVHPHAHSRLNTLFKWVKRLDIAELAAKDNHQTNTFVGKTSPPVASYQKVKETKYKHITSVAAKQARSGHRNRAPLLAPCIISHLGEMSPTAIRVIEMATHAYNKLIAAKPCKDGIPLKRKTAEFHTRFKDTIMCANVGCRLR